MKILPINNTFNINKNHNLQISFKEIDDGGGYYIRTDSYVDETGLHYSRNRAELPMFAPIIEDRTERVRPKNIYEIRENAFLTQERYDDERSYSYEFNKVKKTIQKAFYDLDLEKINTLINGLNGERRYYIFQQPFFVLGLADILLTEQNKGLYQTMLDKMERAGSSINVMDEHGITLLEKVMNAENLPYLETIKRMCNSAFHNKDRIAYDPMQKYAFDNIQNPEFKEKCKNLPIKFNEIIDDIKRKDLLSLDKDIQEQMKCGFCNVPYALKESIYMPAYEAGSEYLRMVLDVAQKHFPSEVDRFVNKLTIRF